MKITIEVNEDAILETVGKACERGAIAHWASATYSARSEKSAPHLKIEEQIPGRPKPLVYWVGAAAIKKGLQSRRCAGLAALERGDAPDVVVDTLLQHALFEQIVHARPERSGDDAAKD